MRRVHPVSQGVSVLLDVKDSPGVGGHLSRGAVVHQHLKCGVELVSQRVQAVVWGEQGCLPWSVLRREVGSLDAVEPRHGTRFAVFAPALHQACLERPQDAVSVERVLVSMVPVVVSTLLEPLVPPPGCWAEAFAPWA